jgi:DNA-binding MarR family transcriptional regulator
MAEVAHQMSANERTDGLLQVLIDVVWTAHKVRAVGGGVGAVNASGGGTWGVLHTLVRHGPRTVPQIARMRPVARQHIQILANELAEQGFVTFEDNPAHKRSKLVTLTQSGRNHYDDVKKTLDSIVSDLGARLEASDVVATQRLLSHVMAELDQRLAED